MNSTPSDDVDCGEQFRSDDLSRDVYGVLGIPIDAVDLAEAVRRIGEAACRDAPYLVSTPNLNFLISSQHDAQFRESLLRSDLCPVDGVPIVWISRLLGIPITMRVAGSDIFDRLKLEQGSAVKVFLFGGPEGVAESAARVLNAQASGVTCVGALYPGYGSVEDMSSDAVIDTINASGARFLVTSLGAQKGQAWLLHNHHRLHLPVRSHLGAAINFQAGLLRRAPLFIRRFGFEWLWRIKEEPYLWRRYLQDGSVLLWLMLTRILPLTLGASWRLRRSTDTTGFDISSDDRGLQSRQINLVGSATARHVARAVPVFRDAIVQGGQLTVDLSRLKTIDARFLGLLIMVRKQLLQRGGHLEFSGATSRIKRAFWLNRFEFLLDNGVAAIGRTSIPNVEVSSSSGNV